MTNHVIFDLDNCLSDDEWRLKLIDWHLTDPRDRYARYHAACQADDVANWDVFFAAVQEAKPIFLTARPVEVRQQTLEWIERELGIASPLLLMRNNGDHRPSVIVKQWQLAALLHDEGVPLRNIVAAYDDREDIVEMYKRHGINGIKLSIHNKCALTAPIVEAINMTETPQIAAARAPDLLDAGAATFRQRNAVYGDTYLNFGKLLDAMFPDGLRIEAGDAAGHTRLGVFVQCAGKLSRYAANIHSGGHQDSAHDLMVYAAMLQEVTAAEA